MLMCISCLFFHFRNTKSCSDCCDVTRILLTDNQPRLPSSLKGFLIFKTQKHHIRYGLCHVPSSKYSLFVSVSPCLVTELEGKAAKGPENKETSYVVRLGCLSTKLRRRAYSRAVARIQEGKERSVGFISELNSSVDLVRLVQQRPQRILVDLGQKMQILKKKLLLFRD